MDSSNASLLGDTKAIIKSLVISHPNGVSLTTLCRDYEEMEGEEVPYVKLGFDNLTALLKSMPDMVRPAFGDNHSVTLFPVKDQSTDHIIGLVANQSKKKLRSKAKPRFKKAPQRAPLKRTTRSTTLARPRAPIHSRLGVKPIQTRAGTSLIAPVAVQQTNNTSNHTPINRSQNTSLNTSQSRPQNNTSLQRSQNTAPIVAPLKRPLPSAERMDPRLAKRMNTNKDNEETDTSGVSAAPKPVPTPTSTPKPTPTPTPTKPYHEMKSEEIDSLVSAVRERTPIITSAIEKSRNGIESKMWAEIFDVENVTNLKALSSDTTGLLVAKTQLRQPLKIGEYSLKISTRSDDRLFVPDGSELKYLHIPPAISQINLDLNHGYDMVSDIHWGKPSSTKIDELLRWILMNRKKFMIAGELVPQELHTDFVFYRGLMSKIMTTPYEQNERWVICATKYKGTIYLCQFHETFPPPDDYFNKLSFGGFRFESYLSSYDQEFPPDPNDFDPDHHEYCAVMRTRLLSENTSHSLVFGAELDCVLPNVREHPGTLSNFVELKTTKVMAHEGQYRSFLKYKLLKWWAQSYVVGVPTIYCGYKDQKNVVKELEPLKVDSFPDLCVEFWSANVCLNFLNKFLHHLKELVTIDDPNVVYQFAFQPQRDITCTRLVEPGEFQILPQWYIDEFSY